jgi:hypothetical protein
VISDKKLFHREDTEGAKNGKKIQNYSFDVPAHLKPYLWLFSPSPLTGEGRDEGGFQQRWHPSPYPLPQGARVFLARCVKCIVPKKLNNFFKGKTLEIMGRENAGIEN